MKSIAILTACYSKQPEKHADAANWRLGGKVNV